MTRTRTHSVGLVKISLSVSLYEQVDILSTGLSINSPKVLANQQVRSTLIGGTMRYSLAPSWQKAVQQEKWPRTLKRPFTLSIHLFSFYFPLRSPLHARLQSQSVNSLPNKSNRITRTTRTKDYATSIGPYLPSNITTNSSRAVVARQTNSNFGHDDAAH